MIDKAKTSEIAYMTIQELKIEELDSLMPKLLYDPTSVSWSHLAAVFAAAAVICLDESHREGAE